MRHPKGFTLIEIVVVIALLGVLATLGFRTLTIPTSLPELLADENRVQAELRRARSAALHQLMPADGPPTVSARINEAAKDATTCPTQIDFGYDTLGTAASFDCSGCTPCPSANNARWLITLQNAGQSICLNLSPVTGQATRTSCSGTGN